MTLFGKKVFVDVITFCKDREMRSPWIIQVGPKSNGKCPYESEEKTQTRGEGCVKLEAEIDVMQPQDKECLETPKVERPGRILSKGAFRESIAISIP